MNDIEKVWLNILKNERQIFKTTSGLEFYYEVENNGIKVYRDAKYVGRLLTKNNFEKALKFKNLCGHEFSNRIIGSSYVRAILTDKRIKLKDE